MTAAGRPHKPWMHGIDQRIMTHTAARDGKPIDGRLETVELVIGDRRFPIGDLPVDVPASMLDTHIDKLLEEIRPEVAQAATVLAADRDIRALLRVHGPEIRRIVRDTPEGVDPVGPLVRYFREAQGMSQAALAKAIGRDPGTLRAWETGRPSKCHLLDVERASRALGFNGAALVRLVWVIEGTPV